MQEKINIICCSTDKWDEVWRRRQHLCSEFAKKEWVGKILFVEPAYDIANFIKSYNKQEVKKIGKITQIEEKIYTFRPIWPFPFVRFDLVRKLNFYVYLMQVKKQIKKLNLNNLISWFSHPSYNDIAGKFGEKVIWYDCTDDWSSILVNTKRNAITYYKQTISLLQKASIVTAVSQNLLERAMRYNINSHLMPNGVDFDSYYKVFNKSTEIPQDIARISRPILGYIGSLHEQRIDIDLLKFLNKKRPKWSVVLIGPNFMHKETTNTLEKFTNIHLLGAKRYEEIPNYIKAFDVCIIPHKVSEFTKSLNPIKAYEYLALGKPIIATDVVNPKEFNNVFKTVKKYDEFVHNIEDLLKEDNKDLRDMRIQYAKENSWRYRANNIIELLSENKL